MNQEPLLMTVPDAAKMLGLGRSTLYQLMQAGEVTCVHVGRSVRVPLRALRAYAERLEAEQSRD